MANNGRFEYTISFKTDKTGLQQAKEALQEIQNLTTKTPGFENMGAELGEAKKAAADFESALTRAFNVKLKTTDVSKLRDELQQLDLNSMYKSLSAIGPKGEEAFNRMAVQAMKTNLQIKQGNTLLQRFGTTLRRNIEWMLSGQVIRTVTGVFQKAYGFTKNLDSSLNDIRIVTGKSADEMNRLGQEAQKTAAALSKGTTDITNASLIFYQQGLNTEEANARTEVATKLANVTKQSTDVTADQLTAVWNGYKATNDELERYADIMTAVAANTASSSSELSGAISKVASVANTTGVNMEQLTAMMSTVISVTRESPEAVGTAFKTIFARINDLVEDGTDEFGVSLGRISSHLKAMGIEILDENGNLKDLGTTLTQVGEDWEQYSREQQIAIAEQIGGKRQWNQVVALFDNWNKYADALNVARNSTGELQKQQDIYAESTAAHLQAVKTAWEGVYGQLMSSDDINKVADFFTAVLEKVEAFIKNIGGIGPILQMVAGYMLQAFGPQIGQQMATTINNLRIMKDNASQMAAQQDLTRILGTVEDNALMQKLVKQHQQILKYKNLMTEADRKEYEEYLEQTVALDKKQKDLENEVKLTEKALEGRKQLSEAYRESGNTVDSANFPMQTVDESIEAATTFLKNRSVETEKGVERIGAPRVEVLDDIADSRIGQINKYLKELSKVESANPRAVREFEKLSSALTSVSDDFIKASAQGKINIGSLQSHEDQAKRAATALLKLKGHEKDVIAILKQFTAAEGEHTEFYMENQQALTKSRDNIQKYIRMITELEERQVLTTEQAEKLKNELTRIDSDTASLDNYTNGIRNINSQLTQFVREGLQDLEQVSKAAGEHLDVQQKNVKNNIEVWGNSFNQTVNKLKTENTVNNLTQLVNLTSQLSMTFSQLSSIKNIISDDSLKGSEKMSKVISSLVFMGPMLLTSLTNVYNLTLKDTLQKKAQNLEQAKSLQLQAKEMVVQQQTIIREQELYKIQARRNLEKKREQLIVQREIRDNSILGSADHKAAQAAVEKAEAELKDAQNTHVAAQESHKKAKAALEEARANAAATRDMGLSLENANTGFAGLIENISFSSLVLGALTIAVSLLVFGIQKMKQAQEEEEEAANRATNAQQHYRDSLVELQKTAKNNQTEFQKWEKLWDGWKKGKNNIDEVKTSMEALGEQMGLTEDLEYQRLMRIAKYTDDYSDLERYLDNIIQKQQIVAAGGAPGQSQDGYSAIVTSYQSQIQSSLSANGSTGMIEYGNAKRIHEKEANGESLDVLDREAKVYWDNIDAIIKEIGSVTGEDFFKYLDNLDEYTYDLQSLSPEQLINLDNKIQELKQTDKYKDNDIIKELDKQLTAVRGTIGMMANQLITDSLDNINELVPANLSQLSEKEITQKITEGWEKFTIENDLSDKSEEEIQELYDKYINNIIQNNSSIEELINNFDIRNQTKKLLQNSVEDFWEKNDRKGKFDFIKNDSELNNFLLSVQNQLKAAGTNFYEIDWDKIIQSEDMMNILSEVHNNHRQFTQEELEMFSIYHTEAANVFQTLTQDYSALEDAGENVLEKLQKGSLSQRNLSSNKEFQSIINENVIEELRQVNAGNEENLKIIEAVQNGNVFGPEGQKNLERYIQLLQSAAIETADGNFRKALNDFKELGQRWEHGIKVPINVDEGQFVDAMEDITNADYSVDIEVRTAIDKGTEKIRTEMNNLSSIGSSIGEGFTIASDKLDDFTKFFGESADTMLKTATVLEDGTIQLSQEATQQAIEEKRKEINAEIDSQIKKIEVQNAILKHKKEIYDKMVLIAESMAKGEFKTESTLREKQGELQDYAMQIKLDNDALSAVAEDQLNSERLDKLKQFYVDALTYGEEYKNKLQGIIYSNEVAPTLDDFAEDRNIYTTRREDFENLSREELLKKYGTTVWVGGTTDELSSDSIEAQKEIGEILNALYSERSEEIQKQIDYNLEEINILNLERESWDKMLDRIGQSTESTKDNTNATKDNTNATKDNAAAQAQLIDLLNEEIDAYHDINIEIKQLETQMARLQKQQAKLTGDALIKNLEKQLELLYKQNDAYNRKLELTTMDLAINRSSLESSGVTFNEDGTIANYAEALAAKMQYVQDIQNQYNNMSKEEQDGFKDVIDQAKKDYEDFKNNISEYDKLLTEEIPSLQDKIQELFDQKIEIEISKLQTEIQVVLDEKSFERTRIEFKKKMASIKEEDLLGNNIIDFNILATYTANDGSLVKARQRLEDLRRYQAELDAGNYATPYGDNAAKLAEDLKAAEEEWMNQEEAVKDLADAIKNRLVTALDQAGEKLEEQRQAFSQISDILEHNITLLQLRFGDTAFDKINNLLIEQRKLIQNQLSVALQERQFFKEQMDRLIEQDPNMVEDATKKAVEKYKESMIKVGELTNSVAQAMQKEFENSIQAIFQKLNEELTNGAGLDAIKSSWDRLTEGADEYYDIINSAYEVSKLRSQIEKAINESDNPATQKALSQFLNEQITTLEKKEKLSKYDIDRANALFEIEVKRAAFQEAQQNKSKMRLRRDAQGNYTYQFVSDEEQVANAMQELAEAQNKLYNIDKDGLRNNLNDVQTLLKEYQDAIVEDAKTGGKNREEITAYYEERINDKLKDSEDIRRNLTETALEEYARMTDQSVENLKNMSDQQRDILMNQLVPEYGSALDQMVQKMVGEGGFYAVMGGAFDEIARKTREYFGGLDDLADLTDMSFDTMVDGSIAVIDAMEDLMDSTDTVMDKIKDTTEQILVMAMAISGSPQDLRSALETMNLQLPDIASVIADATDVLTHFNDAADAVVDIANNTNNDINSNNNDNNNNNTGSNTITGLDKNRDDWGENNLPNIGDEVIYLGDDYYYAPDGSGPSGRRGEGENKVVTVENISPGSEYPIAVKSHDSAYGWLKKYQIAKMKVGGYTGDWDDNKGRLAVLHQKELVLNADRTKALMDTFDVLTGKRVSNIGNDILSSVEDKIRQATQEVIRGSIAAIIDKVYHYNQERGQKENIIERPVNINATFPNVVSALEVEKALNNLMNLSTQAAYNTHR